MNKHEQNICDLMQLLHSTMMEATSFTDVRIQCRDSDFYYSKFLFNIFSLCKENGRVYGLPQEENDEILLFDSYATELQDKLNNFYRSNSDVNLIPAPEVNTVNNPDTLDISIASSSQVLCDFCGKDYRDEKALKYHYYMVHRNYIESLSEAYSCTLCGKKFCQLHLLNRHMISHSPSKYNCPFCNRPFKRQDHLNVHIKNTHGKKDSVKCTLCPKTYSHLKGLRRHEKNAHLKEV